MQWSEDIFDGVNLQGPLVKFEKQQIETVQWYVHLL